MEKAMTRMAYEIVTVNKNARKGPFMLYANGYALGFGKDTREDSLSQLIRLIDEHPAWFPPASFSS